VIHVLQELLALEDRDNLVTFVEVFGSDNGAVRTSQFVPALWVGQS
jgi:hypothetical protein